MVIDVGYWVKVLQKVILLAVSVIAIFLSFKLAVFYTPFLIGFIISLLTEPLIRAIVNKTGINRKTSAVIVLIVIFSILIGIVTLGIISIITESSNLLQSLNVYIEKIYNQIQTYTSKLDLDKIRVPEQVITVIETSTERFLEVISKWVSNFLTGVLQGITSLPMVLIYIVITILSTYFICADRLYILDQLEHHFPRLWVKKFGIHLREIVKALGSYLKAEIILVLITFVIVLIGLYLFKLFGLHITYPFLAALGIGFVDALPIVGTGTVMVPWAVISAINGDIRLAIALIVLYIFTVVCRQIIEPKVVSSKIGIHPIFTLIAMYTGFKITGILGLFIGPIILIILKNIFSTMIENGIFKTILDRR